MMLCLNVHGLFEVEVVDPPQADREFLQAELGAFVVPACEAPDLVVRYDANLAQPGSAVRLLPDLSYADGTLIFSNDGKVLHADVRGLPMGRVAVTVQPGLATWHLFSIIEKLLQIRVLGRGCAFIHGGSVASGGEARVVAAMQGGGKTRYVLDELAHGAGFLGDEQVLVRRDGRVFCYPRRVNFKRAHGSHFDAACRTLPPGARRRMWWRRAATSVFLPFAPRPSSMHRVLSREPLVRQEVGRVFPRVPIVRSSRVCELIVLMPGASPGPLSPWSRSQVARFLIQNARDELGQQMGRHARMFLMLGDPVGRAWERTLRGLFRRQVATIARFVHRVPQVHVQATPDSTVPVHSR